MDGLLDVKNGHDGKQTSWRRRRRETDSKDRTAQELSSSQSGFF